MYTISARIIRARLLVSVVTGLLLTSVPVHAQGLTDYDSLIQEGLSEFELGHWVEAYNLFKQAHQRSPNARTLRGMGMASYELQKYPRALEQLQAALDNPDKALQGELRQGVDVLIARTLRLVGTLELFVTPPEAIVLVNREQTDKRRLVVPVGELTVRAELPGHPPQERVLSVDGGQDYAVELDFGAAPLVPPPEAAADSSAEGHGSDLGVQHTAGQAPAGDGGIVSSPWLWAGVGAAVIASVLVAIALGGDDDPGDNPLPTGNVDRSFVVLEMP